MFFAGVIISHAVFYFDKKRKKRLFYTYISAAILQILDSVHSVHKAAVEFAREQSKNVEEAKREEYLKKESQKVSLFMNLYLLLFIKAVPEDGRKYIKYETWTEASALIEELRGFMNGEDKG